MIDLIKYTYLMQTDKIDKELCRLWGRYQEIIDSLDSAWEEINEARAILFMTGNLYLEQVASEAIEKRLEYLEEDFNITEFLYIIDSNSPRLKELRICPKFKELEIYYNIVKKHKNRYVGGKFYLDEERFMRRYNELSPNKKSKVGYRGYFDKCFFEDGKHE